MRNVKVANEIDIPYTFYSGVPYFYGHPWNYYGPSTSLSVYFTHAAPPCGSPPPMPAGLGISDVRNEPRGRAGRIC